MPKSIEDLVEIYTENEELSVWLGLCFFTKMNENDFHSKCGVYKFLNVPRELALRALSDAEKVCPDAQYELYDNNIHNYTRLKVSVAGQIKILDKRVDIDAYATKVLKGEL